MAKITRKDFFKEVLSSPLATPSNATGEDKAFYKYANKKIPEAKKTNLSLASYNGPWTDMHMRHLLRRTMFGMKQSDIDSISGKSMSAVVDTLLDSIPPTPLPPVNNYSAPGTSDMTGIAFGDTWTTGFYGDGTLNAFRNNSYKSWWLGQMSKQSVSITEKMVFFWHNHFATQTLTVGDACFCYVHNVLLRENALGNFKTLVKKITTDCAMLKYLNGHQNIKVAPDENYARELQELFTAGKNNSPNYTEEDVKAAAKVLTGWNVNNSTFNSFFIPALHDTTDKQFSSFYNNTVITGKAGANGAIETDELIEMIFSKYEVAHFICSKLYRFFVYYNITTDIDASIITPLAQLLVDNNFEIKPVLRVLLKSEHFFDENNIGCYIKTPLDHLVGVLRCFNIDLETGFSINETYAAWYYIRSYGAQLGLDLGDAPNVAGWPAYYESPAYYQLWINSSTLPARMQFTDMLLGSGLYYDGSHNPTIDVIAFAKQCSNVEDPDLLIRWMLSLLTGVGVDIDQQNKLKGILLSGQVNNYYWTEAWDNYLSLPDTVNTSIIQTRLNAVLTTILRLPEFQLC